MNTNCPAICEGSRLPIYDKMYIMLVSTKLSAGLSNIGWYSKRLANPPKHLMLDEYYPVHYSYVYTTTTYKDVDNFP